MAFQDNQVTQTTSSEPVSGPVSGPVSETIRNVTGYIHFNKDEDLTKIFETLRSFRTSHNLKYYHHRQGFIFFSVKSDCLTKLREVQPFKISHYNSKSTYSCSKEVGDKLVAVRDSFVRMSWDEGSGQVHFLSRTIGRVHNDLVRRVFKETGETFVRESYHFVPHVPTASDATEKTEPIASTESRERVVRNGRSGRGGRDGRVNTRRTVQQDSGEGFTRVGRDKSKYNKHRVQEESSVPIAPRGGRGGRGGRKTA